MNKKGIREYYDKTARQWADAFYAHSLEELTRAGEGLFAYEREIGDSERSVWVNLVFRRV